VGGSYKTLSLGHLASKVLEQLEREYSTMGKKGVREVSEPLVKTSTKEVGLGLGSRVKSQGKINKLSAPSNLIVLSNTVLLFLDFTACRCCWYLLSEKFVFLGWSCHYIQHDLLRLNDNIGSVSVRRRVQYASSFGNARYPSSPQMMQQSCFPGFALRECKGQSQVNRWTEGP